MVCDLVTAMQDEVIPPAAVRSSDLVGAVWPPGSTLRRPQLVAVVQMAPAGAVLDFRSAPGGAAQWWVFTRILQSQTLPIMPFIN
jgi:hypothetical protein